MGGVVPMLQNYRGLVLKFDFVWGGCCDRDTVGLARGQCDATPRGLTQRLSLSVCLSTRSGGGRVFDSCDPTRLSVAGGQWRLVVACDWDLDSAQWHFSAEWLDP
jgi:hypothetical protein